MKEHPRFNKYWVTRDARIFSGKSGEMVELRQEFTKWAYNRVKLYHKGRRWKVPVHRMVAETYIENPEGKGEVNHIDCDRANNVVENLEWCTHSENMRHGYRVGRVRPPVEYQFKGRRG